jgi:hypothetical protein
VIRLSRAAVFPASASSMEMFIAVKTGFLMATHFSRGGV